MIKDYRQLFIGGKWVDTEDGRVEPVINPATEDIIGMAPVGSRSDTIRAIQAARSAFDNGPWPTMSVAERSAIMIRMAELMESRMEELVALNMAETGCTRAGAQ